MILIKMCHFVIVSTTGIFQDSYSLRTTPTVNEGMFAHLTSDGLNTDMSLGDRGNGFYGWLGMRTSSQLQMLNR